MRRGYLRLALAARRHHAEVDEVHAVLLRGACVCGGCVCVEGVWGEGVCGHNCGEGVAVRVCVECGEGVAVRAWAVAKEEACLARQRACSPA